MISAYQCPVLRKINNLSDFGSELEQFGQKEEHNVKTEYFLISKTTDVSIFSKLHRDK